MTCNYSMIVWKNVGLFKFLRGYRQLVPFNSYNSMCSVTAGDAFFYSTSFDGLIMRQVISNF